MLNFGQALEECKRGKKIQRSGWNGKGMWLVYVPGSTITVVENRPLAKIFRVGEVVTYHPHIDMKAVDGKIFCWNPNQLDMLAEDWQVYD